MAPSPSCTSSADCDDGSACTIDTCDGGICNNPPLCTTNVECSDGNSCTSDRCVNGCCVNTPLCVSSSECNDGDPATTDLCVNGCCQNIPTDLCSNVFCDDNDPCTDDSCDTATGKCVYIDVVCANGETCCEGVCTPGVCCTTDADCDDGDACNGCENCVNGACAPGTPLDCDDGDNCTTDSCDATAGCVNDPIDCDDGLFCNGIESCVSGTCVSSGDPCGTCEICDETNNVCVGGFCELHGVITGNVPIPPGITGQCPNEDNGSADLIIALSGAPAGSVVTSVQVKYELDHLCHVDLRVRVWGRTSGGNERGAVIREACDVGGGCGGCTSGPLSETVFGIHDMDGLDPNQDWHLSVDDCWELDDVGALTYFEIWVEYSSP